MVERGAKIVIGIAIGWLTGLAITKGDGVDVAIAALAWIAWVALPLTAARD